MPSLTAGRLRLRQPANALALVALVLAVGSGKLMDEDWLRDGQFQQLVYSVHLLAWLLIALAVTLRVGAVLQRVGLPLARSMASLQLRPGDLPGIMMTNATGSSNRLLRCSLSFFISVLFGKVLYLILGRGTSDAIFTVLLLIITGFGSLLVTWNDQLAYALFIWLSLLLFTFLFRPITLGYTEALMLPLSIFFIQFYTKSSRIITAVLLVIVRVLTPFLWFITLQGSNITNEVCGLFAILIYLWFVGAMAIDSMVPALQKKLRNQAATRANFLLRLLILR